MFYSSYAHYDKLSEPMRQMLSGLTARHSGSMFREQSRRFGYKLHLGPRGAPENVGDDFVASRESDMCMGSAQTRELTLWWCDRRPGHPYQRRHRFQHAARQPDVH